MFGLQYMPKALKHPGVITRMEGSTLTIKIIQTAACATCSVKRACHVSEQKEKYINVPFLPRYAHHQVGDEVTLVGKRSMGMRAVLLAFVLPFCILITILALYAHLYPGKEAEAAGISIASLMPYYALLYISREKISQSFTFELED